MFKTGFLHWLGHVTTHALSNAEAKLLILPAETAVSADAGYGVPNVTGPDVAECAASWKPPPALRNRLDCVLLEGFRR
ncbi:hypothetical protein J6590_057503 [Homalodisca vitripennis]|nr:hypothetical protein J6590_057503 [Homalodisca vitripennis]